MKRFWTKFFQVATRFHIHVTGHMGGFTSHGFLPQRSLSLMVIIVKGPIFNPNHDIFRNLTELLQKHKHVVLVPKLN